MPVELKEKYPFSVDTWTFQSKTKKRHFLTHAHSDHTSGIESFWQRRIYCTDMTRRLLLRRFPKLNSTRFSILEIGEAKLVLDDLESYTVTAFEANHCPGAVMLLFEGNFGNVLHTGDCRLTDTCLKSLPCKYKAQHCVLDCVFLDCTFGKERLRMPSKKEAFQQVQQCILNHPKAPIVYLACDVLGQEELLVELVAYFRTKIFVDSNLLPEYYADMKLVAPYLFTEDPLSTRFHICEGFPKLYERAKMKFIQAHRLRQPEPLYIRPSAQWYTYEERLEGAGCGMLLNVALKRPSAQRHRTLPAPKAAEKDQYGVWHVCYSIHSSRSELEIAMQFLWPKEVISTTPHCHASEIMLERAGLFHIDSSEEPKETLKSCHSTRNVTVERGDSPTVKNDLTQVRALSAGMEHSTDHITKEGCREGSSLKNIVPLFGMARHSIPSSPPLSFASSDSQPDEEYFNSQSGEEYFSDGGYRTPDKTLANEVDTSPDSYDSGFHDALGETVLVSPEKIDEQEVNKRIESPGTSSWQCLGTAPDEQTLTDPEGLISATGVIVGASKDISVLPKTNKRVKGASVLEESTRKLYRSLRAPIPPPLPSLLDIYYLS